MIEVALTRVGDRLEPFSHEDAEVLRDVPEGAAIRARLTTPRKQRSYRQLALFWAACAQVADNDLRLTTKDMVAEWVKVSLRHVDYWIAMPDGSVHIKTASISYADLPHMEAQAFFQRAWPLLADRIGVTVEELLAETEEQARIRSLIREAV